MNVRDKAIKKVKDYLKTNSGKVSMPKAILLREELRKAGFIFPKFESVESYLARNKKITILPPSLYVPPISPFVYVYESPDL